MTAFDSAITLNGKRYPVTAPPVEQTITQFPEKIIEGREPEAADHTLISTLGLGDFSGGWGRRVMEKGGTNDQFWWSSLDTRWPSYIVTLPKGYATTIGGSASYVSMMEGGWARCIESTNNTPRALWYAGVKFQVCNGIFANTGFGTEWSTPLVTTTLAGGGIAFITDSVPFQGGQLWACADSTRAPIAYRYNASDITAAVTTSTSVPLAMKFAVLGENVYMAGHKAGDAKTIYISTSTAPYSSTAWTDILSFQRDDKDKSIWFFVQGYDGRGQPCFYLGTSQSVYQIDIVRGIAQKIFTFPKAYLTTGTVPVSACVWDKTGNLYVAAEQNVWEFDGGGYQNISPWNGDGMPSGTATLGYDSFDLSGNFVDVFPRREELCLVLPGGTTAANKAPLLLSWRNGTWHTLMQAQAATVGWLFGKGIALENKVMIRAEAQATGLFTGILGLTDQDSNVPVYARQASEWSYDWFLSGTLVTPWWNAGFPFDPKLVSSAVMEGGPANVSIYVYQDVADANATIIGSARDLAADGTLKEASTSPTVGPFSVHRARFQIAMFTSNSTSGRLPGVLRVLGIKYELVPPTLWGWRPEVNLTNDFEGRSPDAMLAELKVLVDTLTPLAFSYGQEVPAASPRYVRVSAMALTTSLDPATLDPQTTVHLTLLEPRPTAGFV